MKTRMDFMRYAMVFVLIAVLIAVLGAPLAAQAQTATPETQKVQVMLESFLQHWEQQISTNGTKLLRDGDLKITPQAGYANATLPYLRVMRADGSSLDIGTIIVNISPDTMPGRWKMSIALPTPMMGKNDKGIEDLRIDWGKTQKFSGLWDETFGQFITLNGAYQDVKILLQDQAKKKFINIVLGSVQTKIDLRPDGQDLWSGPITLVEAQRISVKPSDGGEATLGDFSVNGEIRKQNLLRIKQDQEKIQGLLTQMQKAQQERRYDLVLEDALQDAFMDLFLNASNGVTSRISMNNLSVHQPALAENPAQDIQLQHADVSMEVNDISQPLAQLDLGFAFNGLMLTPEPAQNAGLTPAQARAQFSLKKLPVRAIADLLHNHMQASATGTPPVGLFALLFQLPPLLAQSGTVLDFQQGAARNADYTLTHEGSAFADATAVMSFIGKSVLRVKGLDTIIARLEAQNSPMADTLRKWQNIGEVIKGQETIFDFELTPTGKFLINGTDSATLFAPPPDVATPANPPPAGSQ